MPVEMVVLTAEDLRRRPVREERSRWRDLSLNDRHRLWGYDCPAVDVDQLFVEYNYGKAVALVEYKEETASIDLGSSSIKALVDLVRPGVYVFLSKYRKDFTRWTVFPLNDASLEKFGGIDTVDLPEIRYVKFLYWLRGFELSRCAQGYLLDQFRKDSALLSQSTKVLPIRKTETVFADVCQFFDLSQPRNAYRDAMTLLSRVMQRFDKKALKNLRKKHG